MDADQIPSDQEPARESVRLFLGEAWMMCHECGAKLWSFDGHEDRSRSCPCMKRGKCEPR